VTSGPAFVAAGLRLPVGSRILGAWIYLNPNGASCLVAIVRYRPLNGTAATLASANSTNGTAIEAVKMTLNHDVVKDWDYALAGIDLIGGGILYGARIKYRPSE